MNGSDKSTKRTGPMIVENYHDYTPPPKTRESVELLLRYVPPEYLVGLQSIVLSNIGAFTRKERKSAALGRRGKVSLAKTRGWYSGSRKKGFPASIRLNIDRIEASDVSWFRHIPLLRYQALSEVLYHEIGHHIHFAHRPVHDGKENVAEDWQRKLFRRFARARYPFLVPVLRMLYPIVRRIGRRMLRGKVPANDPIFKD
jgi:hypothetical protein